VFVVAAGIACVAACERNPERAASTGDYPTRAVVLADWTPDGYASAGAAQSVSVIDGLGAHAVVVVITAYQSDATNAMPAADPARTPSIASLGAVAAAVRARGLDLIVKPHVDLDDGTWRGTIHPRDIRGWFAAYRAFVLPLARWAQSAGASVFVVGTELAGTIENESMWRALIAEVRQEFDGVVTYAASWDEAALVPFWDAVDRTGVDFYAPVAGRKNPGRIELLAGWQPWIARLSQLSQRTGHAILLTEIGYRILDGAGENPFAFEPGGTPDPGEQADLYWAALEALAGHNWLDGLCWWNWRVTGVAHEPTGYSPAGEPAEEVLRNAWTQ